MTAVLNIAAYRFVDLPDREALAQRLKAMAGEALKGTILLAEEGINCFLAGAPADVRRFLDELRADPRFAGLQAKESWSATQPFRKLRIRLKREIIRMDHPAISPAAGRAPGVDAATLKRWLDAGRDDAGRPVVMLDTRNAFEVAAGRFAGAIDWHLSKFTEFPQAVAAHRGELAGKTVVSYCTGGIRCEKAAILMQQLGVQHVFQLEGGILQYFEDLGGEAGAPHYEGACVVFDDRQALDPGLRPVAVQPLEASDGMPPMPAADRRIKA